jgi:hypothetical protein
MAVATHDRNHTLEEEYDRDGLKHGYERWTTAHAHILSQALYIQGEKYHQMWWHPNKTIKQEEIYTYTGNDVTINLTSYNEDGTIIEDWTVKNGQRHGLSRFCCHDGTMKWTEYVNGYVNGLSATFYTNMRRQIVIQREKDGYNMIMASHNK